MVFPDPLSRFNSGPYDLNLIKKYFVSHIAQSADVKVANKQKKVMYMSTPMFRFLGNSYCNYISPNHPPQFCVVEKGLSGELRLVWTHQIWG